jgi:hypothetical protein
MVTRNRNEPENSTFRRKDVKESITQDLPTDVHETSTIK